LSRQIRDLEDQVGCELFSRGARVRELIALASTPAREAQA
jgi:DNA-binding transcriptional LysR family regulator